MLKNSIKWYLKQLLLDTNLKVKIFCLLIGACVGTIMAERSNIDY